MGLHINKCEACGIYTIKDNCPECGSHTINPRPARFSLEDRYGKYRRLMKIQSSKSKIIHERNNY
ncbi:MAG: RNA-protein complex protein Nop10 [Candidatus Methanomarinus sp.]|uniref:RNA-protein complex protein Nop10 n=1 Tax=Candidatus Methanomarinus sp. TaxID=3386244 RepID=A0AC61S9S2_9EURY|nr:MAG: Ribosome biogenesis protein Nop10 [ANME-2 cluster archaeon HR1]TKY91496.1 MAG: RNA-protein complex protein Nop10 [ANME-2 cluster archaeon]